MKKILLKDFLIIGNTFLPFRGKDGFQLIFHVGPFQFVAAMR